MTTIHGSGTLSSEKRDLDAFQAIEVGGAVELQATVGEPQEVHVTADDNILPFIETVVQDGCLIVRTESGYDWESKAHRPLIAVTVAHLTEVTAGGATVVALTGLSGERFRLEVSGASKASAAGSVDRLEVEASGASSLRLNDLTASTATVEASGASSIEVSARESISGSASGASRVRCQGTQSVSLRTSGAASVGRVS
ncbi:MAG: GIN domain-containing protein [Dehalococcoidia bacterium]